jgi:Na+/proline symporter
MSIGTLTILITVLVTAAFAGLGIAYSTRSRIDAEGFLVSRNWAGGWIATATLVASVMGAWILFSPGETATWAGIVGLIGYAVGQAAPLLAFVVIGSRMRRLMPSGHSLTEFAWHRYGPFAYSLTVAIVVFYMFVFLAAELTGIALAINLIGGTSLIVSAIIVGGLTVLYTAYGGIRASLFTDAIQFTLIIPLLAIVLLALGFSLDWFGPALDVVREESGHLLSLSHGPGIELAFTLLIAVWAANMFHQGFWQRVYTVKDERTLRRGFLIAGLIVIPLILLIGYMGIVAIGEGVATPFDSVALFRLAQDALPDWALLTIVALALLLVMSSMDTLLNGISSALSADLAHFKPEWGGRTILRFSRATTALLIAPAIAIASQGYSVLYLFFIADLVCAAAVFPIFYGLYSKRVGQSAVVIAIVVGIIVGALFFPKSNFAAWNSIPWSGKTLVSFGTALGASTVLVVLADVVQRFFKIGTDYRFETLTDAVKPIRD